MNHTYNMSNHVWEIDLPDLLGVKDQATLSSMKELEEWREGGRNVPQENIVGIMINDISPADRFITSLECNKFSFEELKRFDIFFMQVLKGNLKKVLASFERKLGKEKAWKRFVEYLESNPMDLKIFLSLTY